MSARSRPRTSRYLVKQAGGLLLVSLAGIALFLALRWPFTEQRIVAALERATGSDVQVGRFRTDLLPQPGCTAENLTVSRASENPIARAERLTIRTTWWTLLTFQKRVSQLRIEQHRLLRRCSHSRVITSSR